MATGSFVAQTVDASRAYRWSREGAGFEKMRPFPLGTRLDTIGNRVWFPVRFSVGLKM
jgi:hypothetical protein